MIDLSADRFGSPPMTASTPSISSRAPRGDASAEMTIAITVNHRPYGAFML